MNRAGFFLQKNPALFCKFIGLQSGIALAIPLAFFRSLDRCIEGFHFGLFQWQRKVSFDALLDWITVAYNMQYGHPLS